MVKINIAASSTRYFLKRKCHRRKKLIRGSNVFQCSGLNSVGIDFNFCENKASKELLASSIFSKSFSSACQVCAVCSNFKLSKRTTKFLSKSNSLRSETEILDSSAFQLSAEGIKFKAVKFSKRALIISSKSLKSLSVVLSMCMFNFRS